MGLPEAMRSAEQCSRHVCVCAAALPGDGAVPIPLPLYLLGLDIQERWTFAVDITAARDLFMVRDKQRARIYHYHHSIR